MYILIKVSLLPILLRNFFSCISQSSQLFICKYMKEKYRKGCFEILNLKYEECCSNRRLGYLRCQTISLLFSTQISIV